MDMAILGCSESWFSSILASPFSGCSDLWASLIGVSELWVYSILASWVFGCPDSWVYCTPGSSDSSAHLDLQLSVWMFAAGRMVLRFFLAVINNHLPGERERARESERERERARAGEAQQETRVLSEQQPGKQVGSHSLAHVKRVYPSTGNLPWGSI